MSEKEAVLQRAREWFTKQDFGECLNENCRAVNKWKLGEVGEVNKVRYNKREGHAESAPDDPGPNYVVPVTCGWCGHDYFHYEE